MNEYHFVVTVTCETRKQAEEVLAERIGYDEDYGFRYEIDWDYLYKEDWEILPK